MRRSSRLRRAIAADRRSFYRFPSVSSLLSTFTPEGVTPLVAALVVTASYFTSALTASFGLGGGLALLALMSALFPPAAVVPVHGVAQLGSNLSRATLQRAHIVWPVVLWFSVGGLLGSLLGGRLYVALPEGLLKAGVGAFVLFTVLGPKPSGFSPGAKSFFLTGAASGFLTMFFSATGPIAAAMISAAKLDKLRTVATHAGCMVAQHATKTLVFGAIGFAFADWALLIALILAAGFLGAWSGTKLLRRLPEQDFRRGFTAVLVAFGAYLLAAGLIEMFRTG